MDLQPASGAQPGVFQVGAHIFTATAGSAPAEVASVWLNRPKWAVLVDAIGEVLAGHADHTALPDLQFTIVEESIPPFTPT